MKTILTSFAVLITTASLAQDTTASQQLVKPAISFNGYVEGYYGYDLNKPADNNRPSFIYSHNRHNEFAINLAYVKASYSSERARATLALAAGTYMNANYAAEHGVLKNIYEASAGFKLLRNKSLWIDAGLLPSHIGFESANSQSCWTLTRSIIAENSPYYEGGAKLTYNTDNGNWLISVLALNGWQRAQRIPSNSLMSWGAQVQVKPSERLLLNYSNFLGTDKPDSARLWRYFHNLYAIFQVTDQWGVTLGLDLGQEQAALGSNEMNTWLGSSAILQYKPNNKWAFALRGEYYRDENGVIISTGTPNGFRTFGGSFNVDRLIHENVWWRTEFKAYESRDNIFSKQNEMQDNNAAITTSISISF